MKKAALILAIFFVPIIIIVMVVIFSGSSSVPPPAKVTLTIWGTEPAANFSGIIASYSGSHPYVTIAYSQVSDTNYRNRLIEQWALGTGPDIFAYPADEMESYMSFMIPAPAKTASYTYTKTKQFGIKEEIKITKSELAGPTATNVQNDYIDIASTNLLSGASVYGLPLSIETLVLYSNRDLLNQARIAVPASTWNDFVQQVPTMTIINANGDIIRSGASLGTTENITHSSEIIALLVLQNGGSIVNPLTGSTALGTTNPTGTEEALLFYTDFARIQKSVFSWNELQEQSLNAFAAGNVAYYIGLPSDEEKIVSRSTGLSYDITDMLQIDPRQPVNLGVYQGYGVAKSSKSTDTAWNFLQYAASNQGATLYVNASGNIPARTDLLNVFINDSTNPKFSTYAGQALTAQSWYRGNQKDAIVAIITTLVEGLRVSSNTYAVLANDAIEQMKILQK